MSDRFNLFRVRIAASRKRPRLDSAAVTAAHLMRRDQRSMQRRRAPRKQHAGLASLSPATTLIFPLVGAGAVITPRSFSFRASATFSVCLVHRVNIHLEPTTDKLSPLDRQINRSQAR